MENISFQYPSWFVILGIIGGFCFAAFLYYRTNKFADKKNFVRPLLVGLRFITVCAALFLLIGPYLRSSEEQSKNPTIALVLDDSESVGQWLNKTGLSGYKASLGQLEERLGNKYNIDTYSFGKEVNQAKAEDLAFSEQITNLNKPLQYVSDIYEGENLGAIVLATDGIFNEGKSPNYANYKFNVPIYSIALGDTSRQKDLVLKRVFNNEIAYLNDRLVVQVDIQAFNSTGEFSRLTVEKEQVSGFRTLVTEDIRIQNDNFFQTIEVNLDMSEVGVNHLRFRLNRLNNESNYSNNRKDVFIEVLDARQQILIIANSPHPDVTAVKQILESNINYDVEVTFEDPSASLLSESNLVIYHNLPSDKKDISRSISILDQQKTPRMFILGTQTSLGKFNQLSPAVQVNGQTGIVNEAQAVLEEQFNYFTIKSELTNSLNRFPPLKSPFGEYRLSGSLQTLLFQKIGSVETDFPLLSFLDRDGIKTAYLFGEGIWKWKLFDYLESQNFDAVSELINKAIIYTSTKEDKRKFRVNAFQNIFLENEEIEFSAELYNSSYELINDPDVFHIIKNSAGEEFEFTFSKSDNAYTLNTGRFSPGNYAFSSSTNYNGESYTASGRFTVSEIQYELFDQEAKFNVLYDLADTYNGKVYYPDEIQVLEEDLLNNNNLKPILYQNFITKPFIDLKWLFFMIAALLTLEWFLRRYFGSL